MSARYFINVACARLAISLGVLMVYLGLRTGKRDLVAGGIFLTVVMCCFALYVLGVPAQNEERNRHK